MSAGLDRKQGSVSDVEGEHAATPWQGENFGLFRRVIGLNDRSGSALSSIYTMFSARISPPSFPQADANASRGAIVLLAGVCAANELMKARRGQTFPDDDAGRPAVFALVERGAVPQDSLSLGRRADVGPRGHGCTVQVPAVTTQTLVCRREAMILCRRV